MDPLLRANIQCTNDFYDHYWRGEGDDWKKKHRMGLREPHFLRMDVPRRRGFPRSANTPPEGPRIDPGEDRQRWEGGRGDNRRNQLQQEIEQGAYGILNLTQPLDLELRKVLGAGGQGMAVLFRLSQAQAPDRDIVVKASIRGHSMENEMLNMEAMMGASHIVQRIYMCNVPPDRQGLVRGTGTARTAALAQLQRRTLQLASIPPFPGAAAPTLPPQVAANARININQEWMDRADLFDTASGIYAMEHMKHGDLYSIIKMKNNHRVHFKDQELWEVFHCLFRAVVALAYSDGWAQGVDPARNFDHIPLQFEDLPQDVNTGTAEDDGALIHFDLDLMNTMMGDFDTRHPNVPIVKVGDLGLADVVLPSSRQDLMWLTLRRKSGKSDIYTPEQNSKDWHYVGSIEDLNNEPVAGQYRWWTNLYQAAHVMWQLITGFMPDTPPQSARCGFILPDGNLKEFWTYGALLLEDNSDNNLVDAGLRNMVSWCMAVKPADRPTLQELDSILLQQTDPARWTQPEAGADVKVSIKDLLNAPIMPLAMMMNAGGPAQGPGP